MGCLRILSLAPLCFVSSMVAIWASEPAPVGYVVGLTDEDDEGSALASCRRDGQDDQTIEVTDGFRVLAGDVITSGKTKVLIAFLDESAVTLDKESSLKVEAYPYPARRSPTAVSVESGSAFFSVTPRPNDAHFMVRMREHTIDVNGTSFKVYTQVDRTGNSYESTVSVTQSKVTLRPKGASAVDIMDGTQVALTSLNKNTAGFMGAETTISQKDLSQAEIKALEIGSATKVEVVVGKNGDIKIKSISENPDGSMTTTTLSEVGGMRTKRVLVTKSGKTITEKITDVGTKVATGQAIENLKVTTNLDGSSGASTVKDSATKDLYMGTTKIIDGARVVDATSKAGQRIVMVTRYPADSSLERLLTIFPPEAQQGTQMTSTYYADGSVTTTKAQVTTTWNGLGFVNVPGTTSEVVVGTAAPTASRPSAFSTGGTPYIGGIPSERILNVADRLIRKPVSR